MMGRWGFDMFFVCGEMVKIGGNIVEMVIQGGGLVPPLLIPFSGTPLLTPIALFKFLTLLLL